MGLATLRVASPKQLRSVITEVPASVIVADTWGSSYDVLDEAERQEIGALARLAPTVLLTGRHWARHVSPEELKVDCIIFKPFELEQLEAAVRRLLT
jgi:hypothetical protein